MAILKEWRQPSTQRLIKRSIQRFSKKPGTTAPPEPQGIPAGTTYQRAKLSLRWPFSLLEPRHKSAGFCAYRFLTNRPVASKHALHEHPALLGSGPHLSLLHSRAHIQATFRSQLYEQIDIKSFLKYIELSRLYLCPTALKNRSDQIYFCYLFNI